MTLGKVSATSPRESGGMLLADFGEYKAGDFGVASNRMWSLLFLGDRGLAGGNSISLNAA